MSQDYTFFADQSSSAEDVYFQEQLAQTIHSGTHSSSNSQSFSPDFFSQSSLSPPYSYPPPGLSSGGSTGSQGSSPLALSGDSPEGTGFAPQDIQQLMTTSGGAAKPNFGMTASFSDMFGIDGLPSGMGEDPSLRYLSNDALISSVFGGAPTPTSRPHTGSIGSNSSGFSYSQNQSAGFNFDRRASLAYSDDNFSVNSGGGGPSLGLMADNQTGYPSGSGLERVPEGFEGISGGLGGWMPATQHGGSFGEAGMMYDSRSVGIPMATTHKGASGAHLRNTSISSKNSANFDGNPPGFTLSGNSSNPRMIPPGHGQAQNQQSFRASAPSYSAVQYQQYHQPAQQQRQSQSSHLPMPSAQDFRAFGGQAVSSNSMVYAAQSQQQGSVPMEQVGSGGVNMAQISGQGQQWPKQEESNEWEPARRGSLTIDGGLAESMIRGMEAMPDIPVPSPLQSVETLPKPVEDHRAAARPKVKGEAEKLHNIVEQRYRKNVQGSLNMLRDSVPRLRHLYRTSTPQQLQTTDVEVNGMMGGLPDLGKETKKTVLVGSRMYIVHLEREVGRLQRRAEWAENFIKMSMSRNDPTSASFDKWRLRSEAELEKMQAEPDRLAAEEEKRLQGVYLDGPGSAEEEGEDGDDGDLDQRPKKKMRGAAPPKGVVSALADKSKKPRKSAGKTSIAAAGSILSSFSVAYTFFPKGSTLFATSTTTSTASTHSGRVLMSAPYVVASRSSDLLAKALPRSSVPEPDLMMDWAWLVILAAVLTAVTWITLEHFVIGSSEEREVAAVIEQREREDELEKAISAGIAGTGRLQKLLGVGGAAGLLWESALWTLSKCRIPLRRDIYVAEEKAWVAIAEAAVGDACKLNALGRWHITLRLLRDIKSDTNAAALLALLLPRSNKAKSRWVIAQKLSSLGDDTVTAPVLSLPFREARNLLQSVQPSTRPITTMADQLVLIHLNDLLSRIYIEIIKSSCKPGPDVQLKTLAANVNDPALSKSLNQTAFKLEVQDVLSGVPKGSEGYTLGLVLIGLWGLVAGQDPLMQRHLANLLVLEHMQGLGGKMTSVEALLSLLSPGRPALLPIIKEPSAAPPSSSGLSEMATKVDVLAQVCIEWVRLLSLAPSLATEDSSRQDRLSSSTLVKTSALHLRVLLAHPAFVRKFEKDRYLNRDVDISSASSDDGSSSQDSVEQFEGDEAPAALDLETETFDRVTDRFIDVLSVVGKRAAKRSQGRDDDSGIEGDIEEL